MSLRATALIMLVACANALLDGKLRNDSQTLDNDIAEFIADAIETIKDSGLDPYKNVGDYYDISLNYPWLGELDLKGYTENFELIGLSNIIYDVRYEEDDLVVYLRFPRLESTIDKAVWEVKHKYNVYEIEYGGRFAVNDFFITVRVNTGSTEPFDEDYKFEVGLGSIESKLNMNIGGNDISEIFNDFMETSIPYLLSVFQEELDNIITKLVLNLPELLER
ncbi:unnamed protein product [Parnassius mnemosyne]|uniref:Uncharacterized protein n=1 Tax=Parnassius mnemosyne TaxID=213953 RepID=A0AAV1LXV3_9NEOP